MPVEFILAIMATESAYGTAKGYREANIGFNM
jgi:uncharacterized FlgJ-related protein